MGQAKDPGPVASGLIVPYDGQALVIVGLFHLEIAKCSKIGGLSFIKAVD
jgi:hypothetical protein